MSKDNKTTILHVEKEADIAIHNLGNVFISGIPDRCPCIDEVIRNQKSMTL